jgi:hypothetical protein
MENSMRAFLRGASTSGLATHFFIKPIVAMSDVLELNSAQRVLQVGPQLLAQAFAALS